MRASVVLLAAACACAGAAEMVGVSGTGDLDPSWPPGAQERVRRLEALLEGEQMRSRLAEDRADRLASRLVDAMENARRTAETAARGLSCDALSPESEARESGGVFRTRPGEVDATGAKAGPPSPESAHNAALRDEIWRLYESEVERQRRAGLDDARDPLGEGGGGLEGGPKSISISCAQPPAVSVTPLHDDEVEQGECMVLSIAAPELEARLVVFCDGRVSTAGVG